MESDHFEDLGYFDSDDSNDSGYYEESDDIEPLANNLNYNLYNMTLPYDSIKEIVYHSDIPTFISLCNSSSAIRKLCTNDLWKLKFGQYQIPIKHNSTFNDWVKSFYDYKNKPVLYKRKSIQLINDLLYHNQQSIVINLNKMLSDDNLIQRLQNVGAKLYFDPTLNAHYPFDRGVSNKKIEIQQTDSLLSSIDIGNYVMSTEAAMKFVYELYMDGYL